MALALIAAATLAVAVVIYHVVESLWFGPLARIPGPKDFALTRFKLAHEDYKGTRTRKVTALHAKYGPVVRVGPNEVSFNSLSAQRAIYGAGSGFERTGFYQMFEAYGRKNMFSFSTVKEHGERKKIFAHVYAKSAMMKGATASMVEHKTKLYLDLLQKDGPRCEIFSNLHYFSLDNISEFLYGRFGKTSCLEGSQKDCALINDIVDIARRKLSWYSVHFPTYTKWLYDYNGIAGSVAHHLYPMQKPTTYSGIRAHALQACKAFSKASEAERANEVSLISKLWAHHKSQKENGLDDLDIASECADHLLAGIDTTSDTLMFLIWSLSRPQNRKYQEQVIHEVRQIPGEDLDASGIPKVQVCDKLPYVDAVIKETLRLFAPLPGTEPRSLPAVTAIDGFTIPPRTTVTMSPYALHRNPDVFEDPFRFNPERWLSSSEGITDCKKWFWAFSSGGKMCIGMQCVRFQFLIPKV